jgi:hypothetical protein
MRATYISTISLKNLKNSLDQKWKMENNDFIILGDFLDGRMT